ncbi:copper chaperone CopZ [Isoptericola sp. CG 20/1183]|uniref:Copper chaperone CopZ n=1 Tax=Isoptericola halotolerans TaxID=300560 RepID=A0ABX5EGC6_9MICO|nr:MULTISPECIES: heavy-metal-associated domain-containing protein [Isoptericola]MCK0117280.1 heavy-metal-associated domain-containing protein [Isoptericola sp. S6320L]PRZ08504.1 copper chaperone CopZ [Isoptericola halotolerans]PRZ11049.1 copper chaperone CopZ [Isoptericola sp. CG 20/1183]
MSTVTTLGVTGMTCANCVAHVTSELENVQGVEHVSIVLENGGESEATVFSDEPLDEQALRDAVDEAGYAVASLTVQPNALREQHAEQAPARQHAHDAAARSFGPGE